MYVNTSNTLNTGHFKILREKIKYVNTLNTGNFQMFMEKTQIRKYVKYAKYGPLSNFEKS